MNVYADNPKHTSDAAQTGARPLRRTWLPRLFNVLNVPMRLLRLPFPTLLSRQLMGVRQRSARKTATYCFMARLVRVG